MNETNNIALFQCRRYFKFSNNVNWLPNIVALRKVTVQYGCGIAFLKYLAD